MVWEWYGSTIPFACTTLPLLLLTNGRLYRLRSGTCYITVHGLWPASNSWCRDEHHEVICICKTRYGHAWYNRSLDDLGIGKKKI
jgi:hypothetical protein